MINAKEVWGALVGNISQHIDNQTGLYAFAGLLILLLIYLIRPKPLKKTIPSLLFLVKQKGKTKKESFFERILRDFLLLFHFLLVLTLAAAATQPFYLSSKDVAADNTVIVLDASASMLVKEWGGTRFEKMLGKANDYLEGKISIIVAGNEPLVLLDKGKKEEAVEVLANLRPTNSLTSLGSSILAGGDLLKDKKGRVIAISDFVNTDSMEPIIAKKTLEAKGIFVEFIEIGSEGKENVGIVDADISEDISKITIQNYNNYSVRLRLKANEDAQEIELQPFGTKKTTFSNKEGDNKAELLVKDDFPLDNIIHVYAPVKKKVRILLITNKEKTYILPALNAYKSAWNSEAEIDIGNPPKIPAIDHDIIILDEVDAGKLPSASIDKIENMVKKKGAGLIVVAHEKLKKIGLKELLPVELDKTVETASKAANLHAVSEITKDVSIPEIRKHLKARLKPGALALAVADDNSTILAIREYGSGNVIYYGIMDDFSSFKLEVSYPLFWQQAIDYLIKAESIENMNYRIGEKMIFDEKRIVVLPSGKSSSLDTLEFNDVGEYDISGRKSYVNLFSSKESSINRIKQDAGSRQYELEMAEEKSKKRLVNLLICAILAVLFAELLYVKIRGDL